MLKWVVAAGMILAAPSLALAQDAEAGAGIFKKKCAACHAIGPGATNKVGPELNGLEGRVAAAHEGFNYSKALKDSGITWDQANLDEWIASPRKKVPGNKMIFPGLKDELEREDLVAYLLSFNADGSNK